MIVYFFVFRYKKNYIFCELYKNLCMFGGMLICFLLDDLKGRCEIK